MIFSLDYKSHNKAKAQEIRCPWNQLGSILKFVKENPFKRYVVIFDKDASYSQVDLLQTIAKDYTIQCSTIPQLIESLNRGYNAFISYPITTWEEFADLRRLKVSDIYIDSPLTFQTDKIKTVKEDIKIRVSPTVSPNSSFSAVKSPETFFIRPEDLFLYEGIIDVVDFKDPREDTLFDIYTRGTFNFNLNELIPDLATSANNLLFSDEFAKYRLNCRQLCKTPSHTCHLCSNYVRMAEALPRLGKND
jgi:hypothetical protein